MKRTTTALCVAAAACWVMVGSAQSTTGSQSGQSGSMSGMHSESGKDTVHLTGCLQQDPSGKGYILTNVTESSTSASSEYGSSSGTSGSGSSSSSSGSQSGTSGSQSSGSMSGQTGTSGSENNVELVAAKSSVDLKAHVGHRIEVTGMPAGKSKNLSSAGTSGSSESGTSGTGSTSGQSGSMSGSSSGSSESNKWAGQKIRVESIRHIADSCSAQ